MSQKKFPLAALISLIPQAVNTISSIVKDKKERKEAESKTNENPELLTGGEVIIDSVKDMVSGSISSKRVMNVAGTTIIIGHGIATDNIIMVALGVVYSLGMAFITYLSEKK